MAKIENRKSKLAIMGRRVGKGRKLPTRRARREGEYGECRGAELQQLLRQLQKIAGGDVEALTCWRRRLLAGALLQRTRDEGRSKATRVRSFQIAGMCRHHHHFRRLAAEQIRRTEICLGIRLVVMEKLGRQHHVQGKSSEFGSLRQQRNVAV